MRIRIEETGEIRELYYTHRATGVDILEDLVNGEMEWNSENECYKASQSHFNAWKNWIREMNEAEDLKEEYAQEHGEAVVEATVREYLDTYPCDLNDEPDAIIAALENAFGPLDS